MSFDEQNIPTSDTIQILESVQSNVSLRDIHYVEATYIAT